jgi:hypothetical protein
MPQQTTNKPGKHKRSNSAYLMQYAGLAAQLLAGIGLAVFLGLKADGFLKLPFPVLGWLLPLLVLGAMFYKIIKDTSTKQ